MERQRTTQQMALLLLLALAVGNAAAQSNATVNTDLRGFITWATQEYCKDQTGAECTTVDLDGTEQYSRTHFPTFDPLTIGGTSSEIVPLPDERILDTTASIVYCPPREFPYRCRLQAQTYKSRGHGTIDGSSHGFGIDSKLAIGTKKTIPSGASVTKQFVAGVSYSYSRSTRDVVVNVDRVDIKPGVGECATIGVAVQRLEKKGYLDLYQTVTGNVFTYQETHRAWKSYDNVKIQHRVIPAATVLQYYITKGQTEPGQSGWKVDKADFGGTAVRSGRMEMDFDLAVSADIIVGAVPVDDPKCKFEQPATT